VKPRGKDTRGGWKWSVLVTALLCAAPVPGDIGACGQPVERLDAKLFFANKKRIDCSRCAECGLATSACALACSSRPPANDAFPDRCLPLLHDGEVCLRALLAASCDDYAPFVDDRDPTVPTECDFCPP
jgi:hypothetical protein